MLDNHCFNCGAHESTVEIPRWAVESIRQQASWVGKRYYPHDEDKDIRRELETLRKRATGRAGLSVKRTENGKYWEVTQKKPGGLSVTVIIESDSEDYAMGRGVVLLPYYSEEDLAEKAGK